jgi:hypothetical protein
MFCFFPPTHHQRKERGMKVLHEDVAPRATTVRADEGVRKEINPKYVVEAVIVQLGLKPSQCNYLWPHYVATVQRQSLVPCIRCGCASESDMVVDVEGPTFLINRTRSVNPEVSKAFKDAREYQGAVTYTKESELMIFNGFCEACLMDIEEYLPPALKSIVPEDPDITVVRDLLAKALRQGHAYEVTKALRRVVDPSGWSIAAGERRE